MTTSSEYFNLDSNTNDPLKRILEEDSHYFTWQMTLLGLDRLIIARSTFSLFMYHATFRDFQFLA